MIAEPTDATPTDRVEFDHAAIHAHITMVHTLAQTSGVDGQLVLACYGENPDTGRKVGEVVQRFEIGDIERMVETIMGYEQHAHLNIYMPWLIVRRGLVGKQRGGKDDLKATLAFVVDCDSDTGKSGKSPLRPPYVIETSPGNSQPVYPLSRALAPHEAIPLAEGLRAVTGGDCGTGDIAHVWRVPGTWNWPNKAKLERGRSHDPQPVKVSTAWAGELINPDDLMTVIAAKSTTSTAKANGHDESGSGFGFRFMQACRTQSMNFEQACAAILSDHDRAGQWARRVDVRQIKRAWDRSPHAPEPEGEGNTTACTERVDLGEWDAGDDTEPPPPRGWLLGNIFARKFMSTLLADGGVGKTALRYAQLLSCAIGRSLTGDHVFQRCKVLIISLEDDADELRRRILALMLHYKIDRQELKGWLFLSAPGGGGGKIMNLDKMGRAIRGILADKLEAVIVARGIDIVSIDPFVKSHSVDENSNSAIDEVVQVLTDLSAKHNISVDAPHHTSKGAADPGNASRGRGASSMKDAARLVYTLAPMSTEEAQAFGIKEEERRLLMRMDSGKVNIAPPLRAARWFRLVGVPLGNATALYPKGDEVQAVEPWTPPDTWAGLSHHLLNMILTAIDAGMPDGNRFTDTPSATDRAAWKVVLEHAHDKTESQAREIIRTWVKNSVLVSYQYDNPVTRKPAKGLRLDTTKRPA